MTTCGWTKGPWYADKRGNIWRRDPDDLYENGGSVGGDKPLASVSRGFYHEDAVGYPVEENARLIASAPKLYEALEAILPYAANMLEHDHPVVAKARAALAAARGKG